MPQCKKCSNTFPNRIKIDNEWKVLSTRKYCLVCSPFGKHNTVQIEKISPVVGKVCNDCKKFKGPDEYYRRRINNSLGPYCKVCTTKQTTERQHKFKIKCVEYKGKGCEICGYSKCISALEFHHRDPEHKDFSIAMVKLTKFCDKIKNELDKCMLVCANCHREIHSAILQSKPKI